MLENIGHIKNPLTIIGIFAGISEIGSATVLPLLDKDIQSIFVWFVIGFPLSLVAVFFATLNFNHKVLYAPSDYQKDDSFLKTIRMTPDEVKGKLEQEANISAAEEKALPTPTIGVPSSQTVSDSKPPEKGIILDHYVAEDLAIREFEKEENIKIERDVKLVVDNNAILFDGMYPNNGIKTFVEVKYLRGNVSHEKYESRLRMEIIKATPALVKDGKSKLIIIFVLAEKFKATDKQADFIFEILKLSKIDVSVKNYYEKELKTKYGLSG